MKSKRHLHDNIGKRSDLSLKFKTLYFKNDLNYQKYVLVNFHEIQNFTNIFFFIFYKNITKCNMHQIRKIVNENKSINFYSFIQHKQR